jgi:hypothetical protein
MPSSSGSYVTLNAAQAKRHYENLNDSPPTSPLLSHRSHDSDDSLRALELAEGPLSVSSDGPRRSGRARSYSMTGFDFQRDLLPLSASLSEPDSAHGEAGEKNLSLINGVFDCTFGRRFSS